MISREFMGERPPAGGDEVRWVECPRDAWQSLPAPVALPARRAFLVACGEAGVRALDAGSFVSPRAVPQLADSAEMLRGLPLPPGTDVLAIVANDRGVERALEVDDVRTLGLPLSLSAAFERRNVGRTPEETWVWLPGWVERVRAAGRTPVVYVSMGFGNPDGEPWHTDATAAAVARVRAAGVERVVVADAVGRARAVDVGEVLRACERPSALGLHLHARPDGWRPLLEEALDIGVRWIEGTFGGLGGCPFAGDALVGNLPSERVVPWLHAKGFVTGIDEGALASLAREAGRLARSVTTR
ncbi:hydroxymethylglutaryl-CoA lyase [soil metagenome]